MFGHSYRFVRISRATEAHSSPRRKFGFVLSFGWLEKRAAIAHTESIRTGGSVPALVRSIVSSVAREKVQNYHLLELPHKARLVEEMVSLAVNVFEEDFGEVLLNLL